MYIEKVIDYFNSKTNSDEFIELELKLLIDPKIKTPSFIINNNKPEDVICISKKLFEHFKNLNTDLKMTQTINFINDETIKELHFDKGVQNKEKKKIYEKKRLHSPIYFTNKDYNFKLSISSESNVNAEVTDFNIIRYKLRFSFVIDFWRIDFTLVKTSNSKSINTIKEIKEKLFENDINQDNILEDANLWIWDYADSIEIEFEYLNEKAMHISDFKKVFESLIKKDVKSLNVLNKIFSEVNISSNKKSENTLKKILPNAIEINKKQYFEEILPNIKDFYITDKADGIRTVLIINNGNISYYNTEYKIILESHKEIQETQLETNQESRETDLKINTNFTNLKETMIECEMINDKFYAFDIIKYDGENVTKKIFEERLKILNMLSDQWANLIIKRFEKPKSKDFKNQIQNVLKQKSDYEIDGIIFTSNDVYKQAKFFKWKPVENMTIDFMVKKCPDELLGIHPYNVKDNKTLYVLFCGISNKYFKKLNVKKILYYNKLFSFTDKFYFPIQFTPSDNPTAYLYWHSGPEIDNKIVELTFASKEWKFVRIREDRNDDVIKKKYYGNNFKVAEIIWRNYSNPLTLDLICSDIESISKEFYFLKHNIDEYCVVRKISNMVKHELIKKVTNYDSKTWVIDLASGKGQDLFKYVTTGINNVLFIDNNENNLCSLIERKYSYLDNTKYDKSSMGIYIQNLDLNAKWSKNIQLIKDSNISINKSDCRLIICNFAIHYLILDEASITNLVDFVNDLMPKDSRFIFTCMNGAKIFDLLKNKESYGDGKKYFIKPCYNDKKFTGVNQEIEILLPFSDGKLYKENLVNLDLIEKKFKKKRILLESQESFDIYMSKFKQNYSDIYEKMTDDDMKYIKLLNFSIYYKK